MNERIRELAEEARLLTGWTVGEVEYQKFAELIVKECADLCLKYAKHEGPFNTMEFRKGQHFNSIIKEHFGVKE